MLVREFLETVNPDQNIDIYMEIRDRENLIVSQCESNRRLHYRKEVYDIYNDRVVEDIKFFGSKITNCIDVVINIK